MRKLAFMLVFVASTAHAQQNPARVREIAAWPAGMVQLDDGWHFRPGDSSAWAQPEFDDSGWQVVSLTGAKPLAAAGMRWYRIHLRLPAGRPPMGMLLKIGKNASQVFINGIPANRCCIRSTFRYYYPGEQFVPLPNGISDLVIAVRCGEARYEYNVIRGDAFAAAAIGPQPVMRQAAEVANSRVLLGQITSFAIDLAICLGGLATLGLFLVQRERREYLWLSAYLLALGLSDLLWCLSQKWMPFSVNALGGDPLDWICAVLQIEFIFAFACERVGRAWRVYQAVLAMGFLAGFFSNWFGWFSSLYGTAEALAPLPAAIGLPVLLVVWLRRGNREAGWLILPSICPLLAGGLFEIYEVTAVGFNSHTLDFLLPVLRFHLGYLGFRLETVGDLLFLVAIGIVLFLRHTRLTRMQERSAAELQAAREMQRRLVPAELPTVPGCTIAASYWPAAEVGGDFYQVLPQPDGSTLIVLGDVSGKGLKAAMTGTLVLGALRSLAQQNPSPSEVLSRLNHQLVLSSDGGFVTCLCSRIDPDRTVTLANAGHLAPYRNGEEVPLEGGLPLGIATEVEYPEIKLRLAANERLTFLSDGVVEAQAATGELFGFERTRAISTQSTQEIAAAAQAHGQQDDITVLTLTFAPAEVVHA
jgi:phosphoserine phosphatase RsbU/P